jgi:ABC-2 type transport system permease protein
VLAPYALPDTANPFATDRGTAGPKGFLALAGMLTSFALSAPVLLVALVAPPLVTLPLGLAWGAAVMLGGTYLAGQRLDLRGPEILMAVTPRR